MNIGFSFDFSDFHALYACISLFMTLCTTLFAQEYLRHEHHHLRYWTFVTITIAATLGVFLSGDLMTAYVCFEIVSLASYPMVAHEENAPAMRAGRTYITISVIGGMAALMGMFLLYTLTGTFDFEALPAACASCTNPARLAAASGCLLFGFGAKAGMFPLHIWLPEAHPVAPAPASALLSGLLTKVGIYGILVLSVMVMRGNTAWGNLILILGTVTMLLGAVLALLAIDLKRILACSSVSQIGFILIGIGMTVLLGDENAIAVRGTILHMVNHSMFKTVLFLTAGTVVMNLHELNLNKIRGFGRGKPFLAFCFLCGAAGIAGVPMLSGYISKSLLHEAIVEYAHLSGLASIHVHEWVFLASGGMTLGYMLKIFVALFIEGPRDKSKAARRYMNPVSRIALLLPALVIAAMGILPGIVMDFLADLGEGFLGVSEPGLRVAYFSAENLKGAGISLAIGVAVYFLVVRGLTMKRRTDGSTVYLNLLPDWLSLERKVYRPFVETVLPAVLGFFAGILDALPNHLIRIGNAALKFLARFFDILPDYLIRWCGKALESTAAFLDILPDAIIAGVGRTVFSIRRPRHKSRLHRIFHSERAEVLHIENRLISRSFSFAMLMTCAGICLLFLYLLFICL